MYEIIFYRDKDGNEPVKEFLDSLLGSNDKDSRIRANKILEYMDKLSEFGTRIGKPTVKYIGDDIWELRPTKDRIFFVGWSGKNFILLHHFVKKSQKTPSKEIATARRRYDDLKERTDSYE